MFTKLKFVLIAAVVLALALVVNSGVTVNKAVAAKAQGQRYNLLAPNAKAYQQALKAIKKAGGKVVFAHPQINAITFSTGKAKLANRLAKIKGVQVGKDQVRSIIRPDLQKDLLGAEITTPEQRPQPQRLDLSQSLPKAADLDPAAGLPGLIWGPQRVGAPEAWALSTGEKAIKVGIADTGIDYTHVDLASQVDMSLLFDAHDPYCELVTGYSDEDINQLIFGGAAPPHEDYYGHGSHVAGIVASALNNTGVNGVAPDITLVELKTGGWCGSYLSSSFIAAILYAADHGIDIVNQSGGGYNDLSDPAGAADQATTHAAIKYARDHGVLLINSAGNDHANMDANGRFLTPGLTTPGDPLFDVTGYYRWPGAMEETVYVSATNRNTEGPSAECPADSLNPGGDFEGLGYNWCKPASDRHQPTAPGAQDQLTYYSTYGDGIDVAAPGGARKFNLPGFARGGTPGWPYTGLGSYYEGSSVSDGYNAWEIFNTTSNYSIGIVCWWITGPGFTPEQCYGNIQGTSMAAPHAAGVAALIASRNLDARGHPARIEALLKKGARQDVENHTAALDPNDFSKAEITGDPCPSGYCYVNPGPAIPFEQAYGAGIVNAWGSFTSSR